MDENLDPQAIIAEAVNPEVAETATTRKHMTQEEWVAKGNDAKEWVSKEEFDRRGPIFDYINELKRSNENLNRKVDHLVTWNQKTAENIQKAELRGYENALREIRARKKEAHDIGDEDAERYYESEDKKYTTEMEAKKAEGPPLSPAQTAFMTKYGERLREDANFFKAADGLAVIEQRRGAKLGLTEDEIYAAIDRRIQEELAEEFDIPVKEPIAAKPKATPPPVGRAVASSTGTPTGHAISELTPAARDVFAAMQKSFGKTYTIDEFINEQISYGNEADLFNKR